MTRDGNRSRPASLLPPTWRPSQWPAPVLNGISVGVGLALLTTLIGMSAGMPAAITAASGAAATSVADTVCTPQAKRDQMLPAVLSSALVATLVAFVHPYPLWMNVAVLLIIFTSIFWMAWGKRGGPQTFVMVLTLVFQMAAFSHTAQHASPTTQHPWWHVGWVVLGAVGIALWSEISIRLLARRYRTQALADSLDALADMIDAQARWTTRQGLADQHDESRTLLQLVTQQAGLAEVFQQGRDLLYSQASKRAKPSALTQAQIMALVHTVNLRDVVQACQLDLDKLPAQLDSRAAIDSLAAQLCDHARQLHAMALACREGRTWSASPPPAIHDNTDDPVLTSLSRRQRHMHALMHDIAQTLACSSTPHATLPPALELQSAQRTVLATLVSPSNWGLAPLRAQFTPTSSVLRYAARATLAVACAQALAHALPWSSHPHWILMTVAVVMRGNLEQTLARRDARIQGTLLGCLIASAILLTADHAAWLFLVLAIALSLAHGFVLINYRVTAAAGAVLALVQGHLFSPEHHAAWIDAVERLGDTLIGAALAWGFSYVLPSWERRQLPLLAGHLLRAQAHYTLHALHWHEQHEQSPRRSHARREVYDVLSQLTQSLQRMEKEPDRVRTWAPHLEMLIIHSHRFIGLLAAIRGLLSSQFNALDAERTALALQGAEQHITASLRGLTSAPLDDEASDADTHDADDDADSPLEEAVHMNQEGPSLDAWLQRRLRQAEREARLLARTARQLRHHATP